MAKTLRFVDGALPWPPSVLAGMNGALLLRRGHSPFELRAGDHGVLPAGTDGLKEWVVHAFANGAVPWVEVSTPDDWRALPQGVGVVLRPDEAGGPSAGVGLVILVRASVAQARPWVVAHASARATAAALAIGAVGAVCDAPLWATDGSPLRPELRDRVAQARTGRDSERRELGDGTFRFLCRGNPEDLRAIRSAADPASKFGPRWWENQNGVVPAPSGVREAAPGRGHSTAHAWTRWWQHVDDHRVLVAQSRAASIDPLGTGRAVAQGPMANVSEGVPFAKTVLDAGAMPFLALGALRPGHAAARLKAWSSALSGPWGAGIIGFDAMPHRDAHIEAVRALGTSGPAAVTLAGATPDFARHVLSLGLNLWLHTPSAHLVTAALDVGVVTVILEGHEAGGHVGAQSASDLWDEAIEITSSRRCKLVLAGGIGDAASAAFAFAMAASSSAAGNAVVVQAGTAFLLSHESVESGAVTSTYAQQGLAVRRTVLVGATVDLPLRCVPNGYTEEARRQERAWKDEGQPIAARRERMEHNNLGRTRIAAQGIERDPAGTPERPYRPVDAARIQAEGAHTLGQGAWLNDRLRRVDQVVHDLSEGAAQILRGEVVADGPVRVAVQVASVPSAPTLTPATSDAVAIVGLGCVLPGAADVATFWDNLLRGVDAVGPIPPHRWDPARYHDPDAHADGPARSYARLCGTVDHRGFNPLDFRIPPRVVPALDPSQRIALMAAAEAVRDAGWDQPGAVDGRRAAVIFGNAMGGEYAKDLAVRVRFREVVAAMVDEGIIAEADREGIETRVEERLAKTLPPVTSESMAGLLANVVAGRIATWLDWMGGNLVVDAACAASLAALSVSVDWLRNRRVDAVLCGGVDTDLSAETFVGFSRTEALSHGLASPFSTSADGFVMGEGAAVLALMRLDDAIAAGRPVWAVIRGVGQSSDGRGPGITAPRADGQRLALHRAWQDAGRSPAVVGVVEAHGTGTALGDRVESTVLTEVLGEAPAPVWLGSVKSGIGHLKGAAGAASLVKASLMVATGTVPATLHAGPVRALGAGPLRLPRFPVLLDPNRRLAAVSAFGFGGTNWHVVLEAPGEGVRTHARAVGLARKAAPLLRPADAAQWADQGADQVLCFGAEDEAGLRRAILALHTVTPEDAAGAPIRLIVVGGAAVQRALAALDGPVPGVFAGHGAPRSLFALVPGQGAQRTGGWATLRLLPASAEALFGFEEPVGDDPLSVHRHLVGAAIGWHAVLGNCDVAMGHSVGEIGALLFAGRMSVVDAWAFAVARGEAFADAPEGGMVRIPLTGTEAQDVATRFGLIVAVLAADHSVLSGPVRSVEAVATLPGSKRLSVTRAYHSPLVAGAQPAIEHAAAAVQWHPGAPVFSIATAAPMTDPATSLVAAVCAPVRKHEAQLAALSAFPGALVVEVGPGATLGRELTNQDSVALDPSPGDPRGTVLAAAALLAAGHPHLLRQLPATLCAVAPALRPVPQRMLPIAPPALHSAPPAEGVRAEVLAALCEVTGYPPEFVRGDADLGTELGIDSIRRMELLSVVEKRLGVRATEADHGLLAGATLDTLIQWVEDRQASPIAVAAGPSVRPGLFVRWDRLLPPGEGRRSVVVDRVGAGDDPIHVTLRCLGRPCPDVVVVDHDDVGGAAAIGFFRSLAREQGRLIRIVEIEATAESSDVEREVFAPGRPDHVLVGPNVVWERTFAPLATHAPQLPPGLVVVAAGNPSGLLGALVAALAPWSPRVLWLGRREPVVGPDTRFARVDLTDAVAVRAAVDAIRTEWGPPQLVLHGAGALADGLASTRTAAHVHHVLGPKWTSTQSLAHATATDPLIRFVTCSSLVAHLGNAGQTLYGAANAAMECVRHANAPTLHLAWTAWSERGMAARTGALPLLAARGLKALTDAEGAALFLSALATSGTVLATANPPPGTSAPAWPLAALTPHGWSVPLDPAEPRLADHQIGGRCLVPAALWVAAFHAVGAGSIRDFVVHVPTFVHEHRQDVVLRVSRQVGELCANGVVLASCRFTRPSELSRLAVARLENLQPAVDLYRPDLLFHGPTWQILTAVAPARTAATVRLNGIADAVDGVHQLACVWAMSQAGWLGLPVAATRWEFAPGPWPTSAQIHLVTKPFDGFASVDAVVCDSEGHLLARAEGVRIAAATATREAAK